MKPHTLSILLSTLALAFAGAAHSAEHERNVFAPPAQATPASAVVVASGTATPSPAPRLVLPPPIPPTDSVALPPVLPPPPLPPVAPADAEPRTKVTVDAPEKHVFLTREQLKERRAACDLARKGPEKLPVSMDGGQVSLRYSLSGDRRCLSAAGAEADWASVSRWSESEAVIHVEPNDSGAARETVVTLSTANGKRASYVLSQPGVVSASRATRRGVSQ